MMRTWDSGIWNRESCNWEFLFGCGRAASGEETMHLAFVLLVLVPMVSGSAPADGSRKPLFRTLDLNRAESAEVELSNGTKANVKLLDVEESRDGVRSAIRQARV